MPIEILRRERNGVTISPFLPEHVTRTYVSWLNDPEVMRYTEARFYTGNTIESARIYVADASARKAELFRILLDGVHVGNIQAGGICPLHRHASVGLIIGDKTVYGRGVGSSAIALLTDYCFEVLALEKLFASMYAENIGSLRAFEKAGYTPEGCLRGHFIYEGSRVDGLMVGRLRTDAR